MANPVFALDLQLASRRNRGAVARWLIAAWLLAQFLALLGLAAWGEGVLKDWSLPHLADLYLQCFAFQHFLFLAIAAPAYLAGSITDDKANGTLPLLLTTELTPWQIIAGKLAARWVQVLMFAFVGLPLFFAVGGCFGLASWHAILGFFLLTGLVLFALGCWSIWVSVRSDQARTAAMRLYTMLGLLAVLILLAIPYGLPRLAPWLPLDVRAVLADIAFHLRCLDPLFVLAPAWGDSDGREFQLRLGIAAVFYTGVGISCLSLSAWRLRAEAVRSLSRTVDRHQKGPRRAPVDDDPVCWRERVAQRPWLRWLAASAIFAVSTGIGWWISDSPRLAYLFPVVWTLATFVFGLFIGIRASGTVTGERERQTWDSLLITPLETWEILVDKRRGVVQRYYLYCAAFALPMLLLSFRSGIGTFVISAGLLLVAWTALYFMASCGVWCSAFSSSSWWSIVGTVARGYGYCIWITLIVAGCYAAVALLLAPVIRFVLTQAGVADVPEWIWLVIASCTFAYLAWRFHKAADLRIWYAQTWVDDRERYGRNFVRSLTRAMRKHQERLDAKQALREAEKLAAVAQPGPAAAESHDTPPPSVNGTADRQERVQIVVSWSPTSEDDAHSSTPREQGRQP
jgi:ABC-type transport system involved in multi-copper enzyme maturation permease subunit